MTLLRHRLATVLGCTALAAGSLMATNAGGAQAAVPVVSTGGVVSSAARAAVSPPGANDFACKPNARHPQPVVLVNGTFETMDKNWATMSPYLAGKGYCVFAFTFFALPDNNQNSPMVRQTLTQIVDFFMDHGIEGVRCDIAGFTPPS